MQHMRSSKKNSALLLIGGHICRSYCEKMALFTDVVNVEEDI